MQREISEVTGRSPRLMGELLEVWERSVRATHHFLSDREIGEIREYVPQALREVPHLIAAWREDGSPAGFMGIAGERLEMLFLAPEERGKAQARGFYERLGFRVRSRSELDEQGRPYPILELRLE